MIEDDDDLREAAAAAGQYLQEIQDYLGPTNDADGRVRFPRGFIRTARHFRGQMPFVTDEGLKANLSYALILTDVLRWLTNRTDLSGTGKEMVIKIGIVLLASICESMAIDATRGVIGQKHSFSERTRRMYDRGMIGARVRDDLQWLWEKRIGIHIYKMEFSEYGRYDITDYNRAIRATRGLRDALQIGTTSA